MNCNGEVSEKCGCIQNGRNIINETGEPHIKIWWDLGRGEIMLLLRENEDKQGK